MIAISAISPAVTALKVISLPPSKSTGTLNAAPGLNPISKRSISPSVTDAILKIADIVNRQKSTGLAENDSRLLRGPVKVLAELPAADAEKLRALGAHAAARVTPPEISDATFHAMMLEYGKEHWAKLEGFGEALANGTLTIQRASDVPELGLGHVQYDLYKDGNMIGGAGFGSGNFNKDLYLQIQAQGIRQATGSFNGHDYYLTWPDATLAKAA